MKLVIKVAIFSIIFAGCGGSFGEGSSIFPKNAVIAQATVENAKQVKSIISQDHNEQYDIRMEFKRSLGQNIGLIMKEVNDIARQTISLETYELHQVQNERNECNDGGYSTMSFSGGEITGVSAKAHYENCESNGKKINGKISINAYGREPKGKGFKYTDTMFNSDVYISKDGITRKILKGSSTKTELVALNLQGKRFWGQRMTINSIVEINNIKTAQENATYDIFLFYSKLISMTKGRIYINNLASYVDYDTNYDAPQSSQLIDTSGFKIGQTENRFNTANGGKIKFAIENRKSIMYIDNDGDGVYEVNTPQ